MNFIDTYKLLEDLYSESIEDNLVEAAYSEASPIDLSQCRMIASDVTDIRGEIESSACLEYKGELTRVQVRTVIVRETEDGKEFLGRDYGRRIALPGGGFDMDKDGDILDTAGREAYEEFNLVLTNIKDTGIAVWSHRDDPWVVKHVVNPEDRWTGYYTIYVTADVTGFGDNEKPEEINKWKWLPIEKLTRVNSKLAAYVNTLNEAIHPDIPEKDQRPDLGEISYLCDSLSTLRKILSRMEIQKTYVREVRWEKGERPIELSPDGKANSRRVKQLSLSTSTNILGHAQRRADKWGFGVILNGAELSRYYGIEPYNHAHHKLATLKLNKVVRLTNEAAELYGGSRVILMFGEYGNRLISCENDADLLLYNKLIKFLEDSGHMQRARDLKYYAGTVGQNSWRYPPFGHEKGKHDARFINLLPNDIDSLYVWPQPFSKNAVPVVEIDEYFQGEFTALMGEYSSFNEEEERIWVENELMNFIQIPPSTMTGLVLPSFFKEDFYSDVPVNFHLAWLKHFVKENSLRIEWHDAKPEFDAYYRKAIDQLNSNDTVESEQQWLTRDADESDFAGILHRANRTKVQYSHADGDEERIAEILSEAAPISVIATAAVKLAITRWMTDLTKWNYKFKYQSARDSAMDYLVDALLPKSQICGKDGNLTKTGKDQLAKLFDYYCPDPPVDEEDA